MPRAARTSSRSGYGVEMPISTAVYEVLYEGKSAAPLIGVLMSRTPKKESDCSWL